jgi:hypothetical protein
MLLPAGRAPAWRRRRTPVAPRRWPPVTARWWRAETGRRRAPAPVRRRWTVIARRRATARHAFAPAGEAPAATAGIIHLLNQTGRQNLGRCEGKRRRHWLGKAHARQDRCCGECCGKNKGLHGHLPHVKRRIENFLSPPEQPLNPPFILQPTSEQYKNARCGRTAPEFHENRAQRPRFRRKSPSYDGDREKSLKPGHDLCFDPPVPSQE